MEMLEAGNALLADDLLAPVAGVTEWNDPLVTSGVDGLANGSPQAVPEPGCAALLLAGLAVALGRGWRGVGPKGHRPTP